MRVIVLIEVFAFLLVFAGCNKQTSGVSDIQQQEEETAKLAAGYDHSGKVKDFVPPAEHFGAVGECPVGGEKIIVNKDTKGAMYKGEVYYFFSLSCLEEFKKNPEKYAEQE